MGMGVHLLACSPPGSGVTFHSDLLISGPLGLGKQECWFTLPHREETDLLLLLLRVKHLKRYSCVSYPHAVLLDNTQIMVAMP